MTAPDILEEARAYVEKAAPSKGRDLVKRLAAELAASRKREAGARAALADDRTALRKRALELAVLAEETFNDSSLLIRDIDNDARPDAAERGAAS